MRRCLLLVAFVWTAGASAQPISLHQTGAIDIATREVLHVTGAPSASIAIVKDGKIAYANAYGFARLDKRLAATPDTRYAIGSVTKQFTAAAVLMLAEEGKLSLDDPVGKYIPGLTSGDRITIRQALSHTSGYRDYWPQDYVIPRLESPASHGDILDRFAKAPLDFEPGSDWQYSNTNYTISGMIVEKLSGDTLFDFMRKRMFEPLGMDSALDYDTNDLGARDAAPYTRYALGPPRPAPRIAPTWLYAAGMLAMTASDLAKWNMAVLKRSLLKPQSYDQQQTSIKLTNGKDSGYGLGLFIGTKSGRRMFEHGGALSGFTSENRIFPDDGVAITVLVNADYGAAQDAIADRITDIVFPDSDDVGRARRIFEDLQNGRIDRSRFSANANAYFDKTAIADIAKSLKPLGNPRSFAASGKRERGGMTAQVFSPVFENGVRLRIVVRTLPDGKIEQFQISRVE
jgi:CubicO group peptidase (beta-lactamase class C family)